jgi:hypothetical protein
MPPDVPPGKHGFHSCTVAFVPLKYRRPALLQKRLLQTAPGAAALRG